MRKSSVEQAQQDLDRVRQELAETIADVKGHLENVSHLSTWVQEYPVTTFMVTFATGLLAGKYLTYHGLTKGLTKTAEVVFGTIVKGVIKEKNSQIFPPPTQATD